MFYSLSSFNILIYLILIWNVCVGVPYFYKLSLKELLELNHLDNYDLIL